MSTCDHCGSPMHPADASANNYCHYCRKEFKITAPVKSMYRKGINELDRLQVDLHILGGAAEGTGIGDQEGNDPD